MIKWIKIFQMQKIDEAIASKRKKIQKYLFEDEKLDKFRELLNLIKKIKQEYLSLNFDKIPSVEVDKIKYEENNKDIVERAKELAKIDLYQHIIGVEEVIDRDLKTNNINEYCNVKLLAILHDAGKSKTLRAKYNISDNITHEEASYIYAKQILKGSSYEFVADFLFKDTRHLKFLQNADKIAREKELKKLNSL
jgi:hypothetical protein